MLQVQRQAKNEYEIETRVINSTEAASVIVTEQELQRAVAEVRNRFSDEEAFTRRWKPTVLAGNAEGGIVPAVQGQRRVGTHSITLAQGQ